MRQSTRGGAVHPAAASGSSAVLSVLVFGSGLCALTYQTVWMRQLRYLFGASTTSTAAVLAVFMGGLGLGGWWLSARVERSDNPLRMYARLELGIAALALATLGLVPLARELYLGLGGSFRMGPWLGTVVRLVLAVVVLGGPAFVMGGTLPALARAAQTVEDRARTGVARLYAANTLGAVAGVVLTTFVALEAIGVPNTLIAAVLLNALVGAIAWRLSTTAPNTSPPAPRPPESPPPSTRSPLPVAVVVAAFGVGFVFFAMEMVWYRALAPLLGGTTYSFGLVLSMALAGIGIGGAWYAKRNRRAAAATRNVLALTCALEAAALSIPWVLGDVVPALALQLRALGAMGPLGLFAGWTIITGGVVLPAAIAAGYQFPVLVSLAGSGDERVGDHVGRVYAFNTFGSVCGAIAAGFGLLPALGLRGLWWTCVLLLVGLSAGLATRLGASRSRNPWDGHSMTAILLLVATPSAMLYGQGPTAVWRHNPIGAGRLEPAKTTAELWVALDDARSSLVWEIEGHESSIAIMGSESYTFRVNGKTDGSAYGDASTVVMAPLLGALMHPDPRSGLIIGLGTGTSAGWLGSVPTMERVDVVELEPSMTELARVCAPVNRAVLDNPKVNIVFGDAREWVQTADRTWDVVMSEPSNPYRSGVASLFSRDFYRLVARRMTDEGVFVQWLQSYEVDAEAVEVVLRTLQSVFPSVEVWLTSSGDLAVVARRSPAPHSLQRLSARVHQEPYLSALDHLFGVRGVEGLFAAHLANPRYAATLATPGARVETDAHPWLEFRFGQTLGGDTFVSGADMIDAASDVGAEHPLVDGPLDWARVLEARQVVAHLLESDASGLYVADDPLADKRREARDAFYENKLALGLSTWREQPEPPRHPDDVFRMAAALAASSDPQAAQTIDGLAESRAIDKSILRARLAYARDDHASAADHLVAAFERARAKPWFEHGALYDAMHRMALGVAEADAEVGRRMFDALSEPFALRTLQSARVGARLQLARVLDFDRLCEAALAEYLPVAPLQRTVIESRAECYADTAHPLYGDAQRGLARLRRLDRHR